MIGTRGWEHASWTGSFYPADLPSEWCFCYYSNQLRSVLVPQETWPAVTRKEVAQWVEDSDPAFRFVLELPAALGVPQAHAKRDQALNAFLELIEPIAARTAGLLLRIAPETPVFPDWFEHFLNRLAGVAPVCADLPDGAWREADVLDALTRQDTGLAWRCVREAAPRPGGHLMIALSSPATPRDARRSIEQLVQWQGEQGVAGLFFDVPEGAAKAAQEAHLIAELMGV